MGYCWLVTAAEFDFKMAFDKNINWEPKQLQIYRT